MGKFMWIRKLVNIIVFTLEKGFADDFISLFSVAEHSLRMNEKRTGKGEF